MSYKSTYPFTRCQRLLVGLLAFTTQIPFQSVLGITINIDDPASIKSAAKIVANDLVNLYSPGSREIGILPPPYYWWEGGGVFGGLVNYWFYTGDDSYVNITTEALLAQVGPYNNYMPPEQNFDLGNDDQAFWALAVMDAAERAFPNPGPRQPQWLYLAQAVFDTQTPRWDTSTCGGGLHWQIFPNNKGYDYKNTVSIGGLFLLSAKLARFTGNQTYQDWAEKTFQWLEDLNFIASNGDVYDGANGATNCTDIVKNRWSYNAGMLIAGSSYMYNITSSVQWQQRTVSLLDSLSGLFFLPTDVMYESACEEYAICNVDQLSFKAYTARWLAVSTQLAPFTDTLITPRLRASAIGAAGQCIGGANGTTCGARWNMTTWDTTSGIGQTLGALDIIQGNLVYEAAPPFKQKDVPAPYTLPPLPSTSTSTSTPTQTPTSTSTVTPTPISSIVVTSSSSTSLVIISASTTTVLGTMTASLFTLTTTSDNISTTSTASIISVTSITSTNTTHKIHKTTPDFLASTVITNSSATSMPLPATTTTTSSTSTIATATGTPTLIVQSATPTPKISAATRAGPAGASFVIPFIFSTLTATIAYMVFTF